MGTYSIYSITRYIIFYKIIRKRNGKYPFTIFNTDKKNEPGVHWWSLWIYIQKITYSYLIHLI